MRVLWVCNIMLPVIAEALHREASNKEGWLSGLLSQIVDREDTGMTLAVAFPAPADAEAPWRLRVPVPRTNPCAADEYNITCYGFREDTVHPDRYQPELEGELRKITEDYDRM